MSKGITIWEPVVGSIGFILVLVLMNELAGVIHGGTFHLRDKDTLTTLVFFFLLSLLGAWLGELWQKTFLKKEKPTGQAL
jgi:Trk-type K+ transport system membrane component